MSRRCMGCMELFGDEFEICPHCGYIVGTPAEEAVHMEPGTLLHDRYIIGKVLGYGGFGVTYIGWDGKLEQKVAVKEYLPSEFSTRMPGQSRLTVFNGDKSEQFHDGLKKFVEEARHLAKFQNEGGIVKIFDSFEENQTAYIVMEYLEGETLTSYLKREKTIPEDRAVAMMIPIMESLQAVHAEGLLHRDIAPDNIFLLKDGSVKLIDFGASRYATTSHSRSLTVIIKPGYSPEEQYRSLGDQGPHTDVYALAATLYKMITGKTPPDAMERRTKYESQSKDILEEPHKLVKTISVNRENAILNAMNVRVEDRTPDVATFIHELNADPPAKRRYGKIKKIDLYSLSLWIKIAVPAALVCIATFVALLLTGVINFSRYSDVIVIPKGVVVVPDVEGEHKDEALKAIESGQLLAQTGGTIQSEYIAAGKIILQSPVGGSYMDVNGTVVLVVSSGSGVVEVKDGKATVPYVVWDKKEDAIAKLQAAGLGDPIIEEAYDEHVAEGQVIHQSLEAGDQVEEGAVITLRISLGAASFSMPDIREKVYADEMKALTAKGLVVTAEYQKNDKIPVGCVISQSVEPGTSVKRGDKVVVTVSSGEDTVKVADVAGKTADEAKSVLNKQGFNVTVLENYDAKVEAGRIISQSPKAGSSQIRGTTVTVYVSKGKQPVSVKLDGNGGTVAKSSMTVLYTAAYGELPVPSRTGYTFAGWYSSASGGKKVQSSTPVETSADHTLYAHWTPASYKATFDGNGGAKSDGAKTVTKTVTYTAAYGELPSVTRVGFTFAGWYTSASGGTRVRPDTKVTATADHTLYARWTPITYTLTLQANGGTVSPSTVRLNYGTYYGTLPTPTRDYYDFVGWYTAASGGTQVTSSFKMGAADTTVYARWKQKALSDWVLAANVPAGGKIEDRKWTYTKTETTESYSTAMDGWTQTGSRWEKSGSGSVNYASFPSTFYTGHTIYKNFAKSAVSAYETETTKRTVSNSQAGYVYWHWMYDSGGSGSIANRAIYHQYGYGPSNNFLYKYFYAFTSTKGDYSGDTYYCNSQGRYNYIINDQHTSYADSGGARRWFRFTYYQSSYTDYKKVFSYQKVTTGLESTAQVSAGGGISDVKEYVRYRAK